MTWPIHNDIPRSYKLCLIKFEQDVHKFELDVHKFELDVHKFELDVHKFEN